MIKKYNQSKQLVVDTTILNKKSIVKNLLKRYDSNKVNELLKNYNFNNVLLTRTDLEIMF